MCKLKGLVHKNNPECITQFLQQDLQTLALMYLHQRLLITSGLLVISNNAEAVILILSKSATSVICAITISGFNYRNLMVKRIYIFLYTL